MTSPARPGRRPGRGAPLTAVHAPKKGQMTVSTPTIENAAQNARQIPRVPRVPRVSRAEAMRRPCEGCGAPAGEPCVPLSMCEAE